MEEKQGFQVVQAGKMVGCACYLPKGMKEALKPVHLLNALQMASSVTMLGVLPLR